MSTDVTGKKIFKRSALTDGLPGLPFVEYDGKKYLLTGSFFTGKLLSSSTSWKSMVPTILRSTPDAFITTAKNGYKYQGRFEEEDDDEGDVTESSFTVGSILNIIVHLYDAYEPEVYSGVFDYRKKQAKSVMEDGCTLAETKTEKILNAGFGWVTGYDGQSLEPEEVAGRVCEDPSVSFGGSNWQIVCKGSAGSTEPYAYCGIESWIRGGLWSIFAEMGAGANVHGKLTVDVSFKITNVHGSAAYPEKIKIPLTATIITMPWEFTNEMYPEGEEAEVAQIISLGDVTVTQTDEGEYEGTLVIEDFVYQIPESKFVRVAIRESKGPRSWVQEFCFNREAGDGDNRFSSSVTCKITPKYEFKQVGDTPQ